MKTKAKANSPWKGLERIAHMGDCESQQREETAYLCREKQSGNFVVAKAVYSRRTPANLIGVKKARIGRTAAAKTLAACQRFAAENGYNLKTGRALK